MEKRIIRVGVMGAANIALRSVIPAIQSLPEMYRLVAVASRSESKGQETATRFGAEYVAGYDALIAHPGIDMIYMPLPTGMHHEWGLKGLKGGKHVLSEKSLGATLSEVKELTDAARDHGLVLMENFMFLYHSQLARIREKLEEGAIGSLKLVRASFGFPPFPDAQNIRYQPALGGGALLDAGAYTLKVAQLLLGYDAEVKGATLLTDPATGVDLHGGALVTNAAGIQAQLAWGFDNFYQCSLELWGNKGKMIAERIFTAPPGYSPRLILERQNERLEFLLTQDNHFINLLKDFHRRIVGGEREDVYQELVRQAELIEEVKKHANDIH